MIGVSHYRHLLGGASTRSTHPLADGLGQLSAAATSALRVATWVRDYFTPPNAAQGSVRLLLSPAESEALDAIAPPATAHSVDQALAGWRRDVRSHPGNIALVYVAGHGIQLSMDGGIVLLEDFADPEAANPLGGAIDIQSVRRGTVSDPNQPDTHTPMRQFYFYDACRVRPSIASKYQGLRAGITLEAPEGDPPDASWVCFGSRARDAAFADPKLRKTLYSEAFLDCLTNKAPAQADGRTVRFAELQLALEDAVAELSRQYDEDQQATLGGGGVITVPVHRRPSLTMSASEQADTRSTRFVVEPRLPLFTRRRGLTGAVVQDEGELEGRALDLVVGREYEAVVPLPSGGEHVQSFVIEPGTDPLEVRVAVPDEVLRHRLSTGRRSVVERRTDVALRADVRFLRWTGGGFEFSAATPRVRRIRRHRYGELSLEVTQGDAGAVARRVLGSGDSHGDPVFVQVRLPGMTSPIIALPLISAPSTARCEVIIDGAPGGKGVSTWPGELAAATAAGYLVAGRADRALSALDLVEETIQPEQDPLRALVRGYCLLKLNQTAGIASWCDELASRIPGLPDTAVIAGLVASRNGRREKAREWLTLAATRGVPIFTEGLSLLTAEVQALGGVTGSGSVCGLALQADFGALCTTLDGLQEVAPSGGGWYRVAATDEQSAPDMYAL
ncbi:hypothetical protein FHT44_006290 [Mycolicibacterium sp. BK634]|uniref:hypothetical protein n=1 Tax=Mycolicibacterium sp. BK634 TaxID=2587099 RepID=UPI00161A12E7|nr:hypothetical protein [Mycolicibacterium sp. BK634]